MNKANKTVLITGSSSGIGRATAELFHSRGWNVIATMRSPERETKLTVLENVLCLPLDVTDPESIRDALKVGINKFKKLDAVVNNAGYALLGPFELTTPEQVQSQFATNVFGLMSVVREVIPYFRKQKGGTLVNVASMGGRLAVPLYSVYHASKWAVEGFSESLQYELGHFNIRVKVIEPGAIKTDFYRRSADLTKPSSPTEYYSFSQKTIAKMNGMGAKGTAPQKVASVIYRASTDNSSKLRYTVGMDAKALLGIRRIIPEVLFRNIIRTSLD